MTPSQKILSKLGLKDPEPIEEQSTPEADQENPRRSFLKNPPWVGWHWAVHLCFLP